MRSPLTLLLLTGCVILPKAVHARLLPLYVWRPPPTSTPTASPSYQPSAHPSSYPTSFPSSQPTSSPIISPSLQPSFSPSSQPSLRPSMQPTLSASSLMQIQKSEDMAKTSKFAFWLTVSLISALLSFAFMGCLCLRRSRKRGSQCLPRVAIQRVAADSGDKNTKDKKQHEEQDKTKDKQLSSVYPSRPKPDENQDKQKQAEKKQAAKKEARQNKSPPEEDDESGWASSMGAMLSSLVPSGLGESSPDTSESPLSLFSCAAAQFTPTTTSPKGKNKEELKRRGDKNKEESKRCGEKKKEKNNEDSKRRGERDKGSVKEHRHRDKRNDDRNTSAASLSFSAEPVAAAEDARPSLTPKRNLTDKYEIESTTSNDWSSTNRRRSRDDSKPKSVNPQSHSSVSQRNSHQHEGPDVRQQDKRSMSKKITYSDSNAANAIGEKNTIDPSGKLESRVEQVKVQTFQQSPNYAGYVSNNYVPTPPHQHNRSQPGYSYNGYGVSPQYPYQVGSGYGMNNYGIPSPQYPYQGDTRYSLSRYSVPGGEYPESGPPVSSTPTPQQGGRCMDPPVLPTQTLPSSEDVKELKQGREDAPASMSQTPPSKRREDPNGMGSVEEHRQRDSKYNDGNDSKRELQQNSKSNNSDRKRDDKEGNGDRSVAHKRNEDDDDNTNPGTTSSTWGFGWLSNSLPKGGNSESIDSIAEESASTDSGASSSSSSSEEDSRYSFVVPNDSSDFESSSSSSSDDSEFSLSGVDDSMFPV